MLTSVLTPHTPRLTASRNGFLARSTALSWPWNKDRLLAARGTMPPSFADVALGLVNPASQPVIRVWCKDPLQRESSGAVPLIAAASPVVPAQAGIQSLPPDDGGAALDPGVREDDGGSCPTAAPAQNPVKRERTGPLRNGNPRGNPNLAPRCGAHTRRTGCPCRAPAMRNGRCRMHGGKSTGPRTEEGRARIRAARTRHGRYSAEGRAFQRNITGLLSRSRQLLRLASQPGPVDAEALRHLLPPDFSKHLLHRETPPVGRPTTPSPANQNPVHREGRALVPGGPAYQAKPIRPAPSAGARWQDLVQRDDSRAGTERPGDPPGATRPTTAVIPARRPILLARPKLLAP
jgi:hypothetical protein